MGYGFSISWNGRLHCFFTSILLGYFIGLRKSSLFQLLFFTTLTFLSYRIFDSERQAFLLPRDKLDKFVSEGVHFEAQTDAS